MKFKKSLIVLLVVLMLVTACSSVYADEAYTTYKYTLGTLPAIPSYTPQDYITGDTLGAGAFNNPQDLYIEDSTKNIYVADTGNKRIVVFDSEYKLVKIYNKFIKSDGTEVTLIEPRSVFVDNDGLMYIPDYKAGIVYVSDKDANIVREIGRPETELLDPDYAFQPEKVIVNKTGIVYVLSYGAYYGAFSYDENNNFLGFYGTNKVTVTPALLLDLYWRKLWTQKQIDTQKLFLPVEFKNMDIDSEDFIYTCTEASSVTSGQVKKLNPLGVNILWYKNKKNNAQTFGDNASTVQSKIVDVNIDEQDFITVVDSVNCRLFQYDQGSNLLSIFGGKGDQFGKFTTPVAIENLNGSFLILDSTKNSITTFAPTQFGLDVRAGVLYYNQGLYDEAVPHFQDVLKRDPTYKIAYLGLGRAFIKEGKFKEAADAFYFARDREYYSEAFTELRNQMLSDNFGLYFAGIVLLFILFFVLMKVKEKYKKSEYDVRLTKWKIPFRIPFHPFGDYDEIKFTKKGSLLVANVIILTRFALVCLQDVYTGFLFSNGLGFALYESIIECFVTFILFVTANWAISTLFDGEGKF